MESVMFVRVIALQVAVDTLYMLTTGTNESMTL
jgi:hypothetical protein